MNIIIKLIFSLLYLLPPFTLMFIIYEDITRSTICTEFNEVLWS
jgi:hypothetical protein